MKSEIICSQIGTVHSPFTSPSLMPVQPAGGMDITARIEVFPEYQEGLNDLEGFSHIILLFYLHKSIGYSLKVTPFLDTVLRGLFSTRAPRRPSPIGLSVVKLESREANILTIRGVDIIDGTPLLDIKPYIPAFEAEEEIKIGWLEGKDRGVSKKRSDKRFYSK